jgi:hypothetical protein
MNTIHKKIIVAILGLIVICSVAALAIWASNDSDDGDDVASLPNLVIILESSVINHNATILSDGSVNQSTEIVTNLTLENLDENKTATGIEIDLIMPLELQVWPTSIYIKAGLITVPLYEDNELITFKMAFWPPKAKHNFELAVRFNETLAGTYSDGETYPVILEMTQEGEHNHTAWKRIVPFTITT